MLKRDWVIPIIWLILLLLTSNNFFFWDTVQLASKQAHFFYDNQFQHFFLPEDINSGHPPFYGMMLALFWLIFGKTLLVSHLMNIIFVMGFWYQSHRLGRYFLGNTMAFCFPLAIFCNPIFLGHSILVSPDNVLCFLLLWAINGLLKRKFVAVLTACLLLSILSMRGMMVVMALFLTEVLYHLFSRQSLKPSIIYKYLPAGFAALIFFTAHYYHNQWLGFHEDSPWQESFQIVGAKGYLRNLGIIGWRFLDFGNVFLWIIIIYGLIKYRLLVPKLKFFLPYVIAFTTVFVLPLAAFEYLSAHRYFMPLYLVFTLSFVVLCQQLPVSKNLFYSILLLLFLGNWWIYPRTISQGWDVNLAHLPFYSLVDQMHEKIQSTSINPEDIGTEFPIKSQAEYLYLDASKPTYKEGEIGKAQYIIYSRVINDYKIEDYEKLQSDYILIEDLHYFFIDLQLYEKR